MSKITAIIVKNLKLIMRSRVSALIIIFGPLLLTLLVGMAFNNRTLININIGAYSPAYSPLVNSFLDKITGAKLNLVKFDTEQKCADSIKRGGVNLCLVFPENFDIAKTESSASNTITFYVDPSQINLVYNVKDLITTQLENRTQELSAELTTILLTNIDNTKTTIISESPVFNDITKANALLKTKQSGIKTKLGSMDLTFNENRFGVDTLEEVNTQIQRSLQGTNGSVRLKLNQSIVLCNDIKVDANGTAMYGDVSSLCTKIKSINTDITSLDQNALQDLDQAITGLKAELESTNAKFSQMKINRDNILAVDLKEMTAATDTTLTKVNALKADLDSIKSNIDSIQIKETTNIVSPIKTSIKPIVSDTYLNYMFPGLIALVIMLVSILLAQTMVMMEKRSMANFRNMVTPTKPGLFLFAGYLTTFFLISIQVLLILSVSSVVFHVDIISNILSTATALVFIVTLFIIIGIIIGVAFATQETSTLAAISFGSISLFVSDMILPIESMPPFIRMVAEFNPFVIGEYILRNTIVFKTQLITLMTEPYSDFGLPAIAFLLGYILLMVLILLALNLFINRSRIPIKKAPKKAEARKTSEEITPSGGESEDPIKKIEDLIDTAFEQIKNKEFDKANLQYVHLNELYAMLPQEKKREYFKKIVKIHQELDKLNREKK